MNILWIVADTFRRDHVGAYGNPDIRTPHLDELARNGVRFDHHYAAAFPTMPARADHFGGRWSMSFMKWEPLPPDFNTLAAVLRGQGYHCAAVVDTPFHLRDEMNYDRGFDTFHYIPGQVRSGGGTSRRGHEGRDVRAGWRQEADRNAPRTMAQAMRWLELNRDDRFFLYVDTWDPHEPWDAPDYYTKLYYPAYEGEIVDPVYGPWHNAPHMTEERLEIAHATYKGEVTMVDAWIGQLLEKLKVLQLEESTAVLFTTDHGFYFGEHGGLFGKMSFALQEDGTLYSHGDPTARWAHSPLYEEIVRIPLLLRLPHERAHATYGGVTSAIDVMPTVLDLCGVPIPPVDGRSMLPGLMNGDGGREFTVSSLPFANVGEDVFSVDHVRRPLTEPVVTTVTTREWSLLYSPAPGRSELYHLPDDPGQSSNVIDRHHDTAKELHRLLVDFLDRTDVAERLLAPRRELRL